MDTREKMDRQMHYLKEKYHAKSALLLSPIVQISSSEIRERIRDGKSINGFVPDNVEEYIKKECLYESQDQ